MQIKSKIILSAFLLAATPSLCSAVPITNTGTPGGKITVLGATEMTTTTLPDFEFQPSTNVVINAASTASSYSIIAVHNSSLDTDNGEAYGMASDVSGIYTTPLEGVKTAPTNAGAGDSSDFGTDWYDPSGEKVTAATP